MRRGRGLYINLIGLTIAVLAVYLLPMTQDGLALSSTVEVNVPDTSILVQGNTSPGSQVTTFINGSESATGLANSAGFFAIEIGNQASGVVLVGVTSTDQNGQTTAQATRSVAVQLQQTSIVSFFLAPTITTQPAQQSFGDDAITFSGYSAPNASVTINIAQNLRTLTAQANSQGFFTVQLITNSLNVGTFNYTVSAQLGANQSEPDTIARQFTITPPLPQPPAPQPAPISPPAQTATPTRPSPITPPRISSPLSGSSIDSSTAVFRGEASPGAEVLVYENEQLIGVVVANADGEWVFYFQAQRESHSFRFEACFAGECSEISEAVDLNFALVRGECLLDIRLESYQLSVVEGEPARLQTSEQLGISEALAFVDWGDGNQQRFDTVDDEVITAEHTYVAAGLYNGYIMLTDDAGCSDVAYFTVQVNEPTPATTSLFIAIIVALGLGIIVGMTILRFRLR